ncbi:uncharacterized protein LOC113507448 [Trichoplusia ni]|uniref:Uncharacterized protein LOC113507448 n=1 Tax=Trichoplusia ni TaxID=7111 RepID=A0A7E5WZ02_TRINI|nr:uncharacterized protein LOC113507448 [Trichoplusia ni]
MVINYLVVSKLDAETIKLWEQQISITCNNDIPCWSELQAFLEARFRALDMIESTKIKTVQPKSVAKPKFFHSNVTSSSGGKGPEAKCALCDGEHYIYSCKKFGEKALKERQEFVQTKKLCFNCLAPSHSVSKCRQSSYCRKCGRRHHTLLHFERGQYIEKPKQGETSSSGIANDKSTGTSNYVSNNEQIVTNFSSEHIQSNSVLLATANVLVNSRNGCKYVVRALLDQGSQASFVTEATVQLLNLNRKSVSGWVSGVGERQTKIKHKVILCVKSCHNPNASVSVEAYVLRSLTTILPTTNLADPGFATPGRIDILLGAEVYSDVLIDGVIKHPLSNLLAQNTMLGWVLSGRMSRDCNSALKNFLSLHVQLKEDEMLKLFWELENEPNIIQKRLSKEEERCEEYYEATTTRDKEGRYVVRLPFKDHYPEGQPNGLKEIAAKRFELLKKKFAKNSKYHEEYSKVLEEYIDLNHMIKVEPKDINNSKAVYLPHHGVIREDKDTTKLRVVFDASCYGTNHVSLNDNMLVGPKLQQDLRHILMRWRTHRICMTADIIKMYRMVRVAEEDTDYQRLLWRPTTSEQVKQYKLVRLTFGTACASYLAVKTLQRLADDEKTKFPAASKITKTDFYMDDLLTGSETEDEAISIYKDMNKLLNLGGFELQKWSSNNENVLKYMGINKRDDHELPLKVNSLVKVLGVNWNRETDNFVYSLNLPETKEPITKRRVLSDVAKLYDPLGWIAPVVVIAKFMIQKLWKMGLGWDDTISEELTSEWLQFRDNLAHIKSVFIPRWLQCFNTSTIELHVFADASQAEYAAAVYIRIVEEGRGAKSYKGYICLFICIVTRAIHLEAVTDLTSKGFIAAFRRFTARRGHCQDLYSDNGTNFVGADKQLKEMFDKAKSSFPSEIAKLLTLERTTWHFIPPHAPNFGGLWEAGIGSTKTHITKVMGNSTLTYEELSTVLAQIECCLNSRPISVLSDNPNDPLPLTPGHFLIGESL